MSANKVELANKKDFRGDILDRQFSVYFDPTTGLYSYDYAEITPEIASELQKLKFYRLASTKLADVEAEVSRLRKKEEVEVVTPPRTKGEITKAAEAYTFGYKAASAIVEKYQPKINSGEALTEEEQEELDDAIIALQKLTRNRTVRIAKTVYNNAERSLNEGKTLSQFEEDAYEGSKEVINAYEKLEKLAEKTEALTAEERAERKRLEDYLNSLDEVVWFQSGVVRDVAEKQEYEDARAFITQMEGTPAERRSLGDVKELASARNIVEEYERKKRGEAAAPAEEEPSILIPRETEVPAAPIDARRPEAPPPTLIPPPAEASRQAAAVPAPRSAYEPLPPIRRERPERKEANENGKEANEPIRPLRRERPERKEANENSKEANQNRKEANEEYEAVRPLRRERPERKEANEDGKESESKEYEGGSRRKRMSRKKRAMKKNKTLKRK